MIIVVSFSFEFNVNILYADCTPQKTSNSLSVIIFYLKNSEERKNIHAEMLPDHGGSD